MYLVVKIRIFDCLSEVPIANILCKTLNCPVSVNIHHMAQQAVTQSVCLYYRVNIPLLCAW